MQKVPAWYTLIGFSLFHQLIDQHCHVGQPLRASKNMGKLPLFPLTDSNSHWLERGSIFLFFSSLPPRSAISLKAYDICWSQSLCGEKTVCVLLSWSLYSLLTCLCQCQGPQGKAWCAMSDSDSLQPRGQTTGWGRAIPHSLVQQAPKQGMNAAMVFHNSYLICWQISVVPNCAKRQKWSHKTLHFKPIGEDAIELKF